MKGKVRREPGQGQAQSLLYTSLICCFSIISKGEILGFPLMRWVYDNAYGAAQSLQLGYLKVKYGFLWMIEDWGAVKVIRFGVHFCAFTFPGGVPCHCEKR